MFKVNTIAGLVQPSKLSFQLWGGEKQLLNLISDTVRGLFIIDFQILCYLRLLLHIVLAINPCNNFVIHTYYN